MSEPQPGPVARAGYALCLLLGLAVIWLSPHPPMLDLPQHAGQLRLLRDLLLGHSPWAGLLEINLWTPYWIAFSLALPLSLILPASVALQLVLSLAYLLFVYFCIRLRRAFAGPAALDWLFLFSFFGFAYKWGFLTFQVAAPVGLAFILLSVHQMRAPTRARALGLCLLGAVMLISHGLVFLYALGVGLLMCAQQPQSWGQRLRLAWPYLALLLLCLVYSVLRAHADARYGIAPTKPAVNWHMGLRHELLYYSLGTGWNTVAALACPVGFLAPWLAGYRIPLQRARLALAPLGVLLVVLLFVPSFMMETSFVYQRFALFLFPAYALAFAAPAVARPRRWPLWALALASAAVLAANAWWVQGFARESADFERVTRGLEPGQRALALVYDSKTGADPSPRFHPYVHYASWYQAEQGGLVDMNFAVAPPQIVRFRPEHMPAVPLNFAWMPERLDWQRHQTQIYRYFFVRLGPGQPAPSFAGSPCPPRLLKVEGAWSVYERPASCPAS